MKYLKHTAMLFLAATVLAACQLVQDCTTFQCRAASGYTLVTSVRNTAGTLLDTKVIGADDAQNIQDYADNAREAIDLSRALYAVQPAAAEDRLGTVIVALQALEKYLLARQAAPTPEVIP